MSATVPRPVVTELRLSAFRGRRRTVMALGPLTLLAGPSGSGKSNALEGLAALGRLGAGLSLPEVFPEPARCVPQQSRPDVQRRRGFRLGCTVDGPLGPIQLEVAIQVEPRLRIVGERLTARDHQLLVTALREPRLRKVHAQWHTGGPQRWVRAGLPDDRLGTAQLPLRVAGSTTGQQLVLRSAEQLLIALRSTFVCDPQPAAMRQPAVPGDGLLRPGCGNVAVVLGRTRAECATRHTALLAEVRMGCRGPIRDLVAERCGPGQLHAVVDRGSAGRTPMGWLSDGELRYLALALVLFVGPEVLETDQVRELPAPRQALTVLADGLDRGLDRQQVAALLDLAARVCRSGRLRLLGTIRDPADAAGVPGVAVVKLSQND